MLVDIESFELKGSFVKKGIYFILLLCISFNYAVAQEVSQTTFLFCLKKEVSPLQIDKKNNRITVDNNDLNNFFDIHSIRDIESWIPNATEMDRDGDIFLNRIYRVYINESNRKNLESIINEISQFSFVHYVGINFHFVSSFGTKVHYLSLFGHQCSCFHYFGINVHYVSLFWHQCSRQPCR